MKPEGEHHVLSLTYALRKIFATRLVGLTVVISSHENELCNLRVIHKERP